jgi:addiction module HigA family antidote
MQMKNPPHPGLLVRNELEGLGIPVAEAAKALGVTRQALYNVINGKTGITPEMAIRLAKGIGGTAEAWSRMQLTYDLAQLPEEEIKVAKLEPRQSASIRGRRQPQPPLKSSSAATSRTCRTRPRAR